MSSETWRLLGLVLCLNVSPLASEPFNLCRLKMAILFLYSDLPNSCFSTFPLGTLSAFSYSFQVKKYLSHVGLDRVVALCKQLGSAISLISKSPNHWFCQPKIFVIIKTSSCIVWKVVSAVPDACNSLASDHFADETC